MSLGIELHVCCVVDTVKLMSFLIVYDVSIFQGKM